MSCHWIRELGARSCIKEVLSGPTGSMSKFVPLADIMLQGHIEQNEKYLAFFPAAGQTSVGDC